jgi:hypothetical protein
MMPVLPQQIRCVDVHSVKAAPAVEAAFRLSTKFIDKLRITANCDPLSIPAIED